MEDREVIAARLEVIAAKAKILASDYKNNRLWDGELNDQLRLIENEISRVRTGAGVSNSNGQWGDH